MPVNIYQLIHFDEYSVTPKYLQLTRCIIKGIEEGNLPKDYILPSINDLSFELDIGRNTAEKAYKYLKQLGIVNSVPGKGYFISRADFRQHLKVFLLFNKLSAHKKIIYDAFASTLGAGASIDFYIYNNDFSLFRKLIQDRKDDYTHYVVIPHFVEEGDNALDIINRLPEGRLILLDRLLPGMKGSYGAVYENFEKDIYEALTKSLKQLEKYQTLKLVFPPYSYFPKEIIKGFERFCLDYAFDHKIVPRLSEELIAEGEVYINLMEDDLVTLLEKINGTSLEVGKQVGVISYNETPLKRFILNGITTISTDFRKMGEMAATMILDNARSIVEVPFTVILRDSL